MENQSGISVVSDKILVLPDEVADTVDGGLIVKPDIAKHQEKWAQTRGTVIDVGPNAFETWDGDTPKVGNRILMCKYAGIDNILGADGKYYKILPDQDITAIITKDPEYQQFQGTRQPLSRE